MCKTITNVPREFHGIYVSRHSNFIVFNQNTAKELRLHDYDYISFRKRDLLQVGITFTTTDTYIPNSVSVTLPLRYDYKGLRKDAPLHKMRRQCRGRKVWKIINVNNTEIFERRCYNLEYDYTLGEMFVDFGKPIPQAG